MRPPLIVLLAASTFANTCSIGAFPSLLPEIGRETALPDWQLGLFAGAFGFARMVADLPAGLFIARRLSTALVAGQIALAAGALVIFAADSFVVLFAGRALMGVGHALSMLGGLTAILQAYATRRLSFALNAVEFTAMIGLLCGAALVALLPGTLAWQTVLLIACAPQVIAMVLLRPVIRALPTRTAARAPAAPATAVVTPRRRSPIVPLAFAAGAGVAIAYASVEQLVLPVRGSREFGLDRAGLARLAMLVQICDITALLPVGMLSDRIGAIRVVAAVSLAMGVASLLIAFAPFAGVVAGAVLFGLAMAGWMLPLSVLRRETPPEQIALRTALYRVGVDAGIFLGPFLGGLLANRHLAVVAVALGVISVWLMREGRVRRAAFEPVQYRP